MKKTILLPTALVVTVTAAFTSPNYCHWQSEPRGLVTPLKFDAAEGHSPTVEQKKPVRRSFLHKLDRFLTELQGTFVDRGTLIITLSYTRASRNDEPSRETRISNREFRSGLGGTCRSARRNSGGRATTWP